ncbi:MAG: hypothetical protein JWM68_1556 [Verrucomicrobiales bacterium]|nr:hypothetical protein [Verrucomicrobiales bacterium]
MNRIPKLQPPDSHHFNAAAGWLELGDHMEANEELEKITPGLRAHPEVLKIRYQVYDRAGKWTVCHDVAKAITEIVPDDCGGWVSLSIALYRLGRTQEAMDTLEPQLNAFPQEWLVHYNLACYAAQLGKLRDAEKFLKGAFSFGDSKTIQQLILDDPDLEPLWNEFRL